MNDVINIYIAVGLIGILIVLLIAQCIKSDKHEYSKSNYIMIKTTNGIIKVTSETLAKEIYKIISTTNKKQHYNINNIIESANKHLDEFIDINPINGGITLSEVKTQIIHDIELNSIVDTSTGVMSDVNNIRNPYNEYIKKLKIVHKMLSNN
jgi:hypothetical protein